MEHEIFSGQLFATISEVRGLLNKYIYALRRPDEITGRRVIFSVINDRYQPNKYLFETEVKLPAIGEEEKVYLGCIELHEVSMEPKPIVDVKIIANPSRPHHSYSPPDVQPAAVSILHRIKYMIGNDLELVDPTLKLKREVVDLDKWLEDDLTKSSSPQTVLDQSGRLDSSQEDEGSKLKMTERRQKRALLFKKIKDDKKDLTQEYLASEATQQMFDIYIEEILEEQPRISQPELDLKSQQMFLEKWGKVQFTIDDVRNDYTDMGWKWERAGRIR